MKMKNVLTGLALIGATLFSAPSALACDTPTGLSATRGAGFIMNLSWNSVSGADSYNFKLYHESSPDQGNAFNVPTNSNDFTLIFCGNYTLEVQAVCGGAESGWTTLVFNFSAPCGSEPVCNAASGLASAYNSTSNRYVLSWNSMPNNFYYLRERQAGSPTWGAVVYAGSNSYTSSQQTCTGYEYQVQHICGPGYWADWSSVSSFTPHTAPEGLYESSVLTTSATLNWNAFSGTSGYTIRYRLVGAPSWTTTTSGTNSKTITGLKKNKSYEWKVLASCGATPGPYSIVETFTTLNARESGDDNVMESEFAIYPNPSSGEVAIRITAGVPCDADILILDLTGKIIQQFHTSVNEGTQTLPIDLRTIESGMYLVKVSTSEGETHISRLLLNR